MRRESKSPSSPRDEEDGVDVRGDDLLLSDVAGRAEQEERLDHGGTAPGARVSPCSSRLHDRHPVAHKPEDPRAARTRVAQPSPDASQPVADYSEDAVEACVC